MITTITTRVDSEKKKKAEAIFEDLGMSFSGAINIFINEVIQYQGIPFELRRHSVPDLSLSKILDETDVYCKTHTNRLSHAEVFGHAREILNAG